MALVTAASGKVEEAVDQLRGCMVLRSEAHAQETTAAAVQGSDARAHNAERLLVEAKAVQLLAVSGLQASTARSARDWRQVVRQAEQAVQLFSASHGAANPSTARAEANLARVLVLATAKGHGQHAVGNVSDPSEAIGKRVAGLLTSAANSMSALPDHPDAAVAKFNTEAFAACADRTADACPEAAVEAGARAEQVLQTQAQRMQLAELRTVLQVRTKSFPSVLQIVRLAEPSAVGFRRAAAAARAQTPCCRIW